MVISWIRGHESVLFILSMVVGGFIGGGKLVILAGALESAPIGVWQIAGLVVFGDLATALIIIANMHHLYRIPALGRHLATAREAGYRVLKIHRWMRRTAAFGLLVFVAVPFQGTGAVLGVVLGRILGLSRLMIVFSTLLGSMTGASLVAIVGNANKQRLSMLLENPVLGIVTVALSLAITFFLGKWFVGQTKRQTNDEMVNR